MPADVVPPSHPSRRSQGLTRLLVVGTLLFASVVAGMPSPAAARQPVPATPVVDVPPVAAPEIPSTEAPLPSEPSGIPPVIPDETAPEPAGVVATALPVACQIVLRVWDSPPPDGATVLTQPSDPVIGASFRVSVTGGGERVLVSDDVGFLNISSTLFRDIGFPVATGDVLSVTQIGTPDGHTLGPAPFSQTFSWQSDYDATCRVEQIIVNASIAAPVSPSASASPAPTATTVATATVAPPATTIPTATATTAPSPTTVPTSTTPPTATPIPTATIPLNFGQIEVVTIARTPVDAPSGEAPVRLPGARFRIVNRTTQAAVATLTTGPNGSARSDLLPLGTYDLILVTPPDGYLTAPSRGFFIEQPTVQYLVFELDVDPNAAATATPRPRQTTAATASATTTTVATATVRPTDRATATATVRATAESTGIATATSPPTATPRPRQSVVATVTATSPPTATPRPRQSPTAPATATATPRPRSSATVRPTVAGTATTRPTMSPTRATTTTPTRSATLAPTRGPTATTTTRPATATTTRPATATVTRAATATPTRPATSTVTRSATLSATATRAPRATRTASVSSTATRVSGTLTPTIRPTRDLTTRTPGATRAATLTPTPAAPIQLVVAVEICIDPRYAWTGEFGLPTTLADLDRSRCRPARSGETQVTLTSTFPTYLPAYRQTGATNGAGRISFTVPGNAGDRIGQLHLEGRAVAQDAGLRMTAGSSLSVQLTVAYPATVAAGPALDAGAAVTGPSAGGLAGWSGVVSVLSLVSAVAGGVWRSSRRR